MPMRVYRALRLHNGGKLVILAALTGILLSVALVGRSLVTNSIDRKVCDKIDKLDLALIAIIQNGGGIPKPGDYGYSYYISHPVEAQHLRENQHKQGPNSPLVLLKSAACDTHNLVRGPAP